MTAIRNFPDAPLAQRKTLPASAYVPAWARDIWNALYRYGQLRAAHELERQAERHALGNPVLARQLRAAAADSRRQSHATAQTRLS